MEADETVTEWPLLYGLVEDDLLREYQELDPVLYIYNTVNIALLVNRPAHLVELKHFPHDGSHWLARGLAVHCTDPDDNLIA